MNVSYSLAFYLHELVGWLSLILEIIGLVVCLRDVRLSTFMVLLVLAFAGFTGVGLMGRLATYALRAGVIPDELSSGLFVVMNAAQVGCTAALVLGLIFVFRDLRERMTFLGEIRRETRERAQP